MFRERLISGIILVAIALAVIILGGPVLFAVLLAISLIGMHELYRAVGLEKGAVNALSIAGYLGCVLYYLVMCTGKADLLLPASVVGITCVMAVYVFAFPRYQAEQVMAAVFGVSYVGIMLSFIYLTRMMDGAKGDGRFIVWLIFVCSWGCDTCAYCAGRLFGKHKMAKVLSPKKTIEGAVGGVIGAALIGWIYGTVAAPYMQTSASAALRFALIGAVGALIAMVGDLAASAIKRNFNIKDYSHLIPGHGGILDRFDSVIFTAPVIYFLARVLLDVSGKV